METKKNDEGVGGSERARAVLEARLQTLELLVGHLLARTGSEATAVVKQLAQDGTKDDAVTRETIVQTLSRIDRFREGKSDETGGT